MTSRIIIAALAALAVSAATLPARAGDTPVNGVSNGQGAGQGTAQGTPTANTHRQQLGGSPFLGELSTHGGVPARTVPQRFR